MQTLRAHGILFLLDEEPGRLLVAPGVVRAYGRGEGGHLGVCQDPQRLQAGRPRPGIRLRRGGHQELRQARVSEAGEGQHGSGQVAGGQTERGDAVIRTRS